MAHDSQDRGTVDTTNESGTRREGLHHPSPSSRETAGTGIDGGRRLFHTTRRAYSSPTELATRDSWSTPILTSACFPEGSSQGSGSAPATIYSQPTVHSSRPTDGTHSRSTSDFDGTSPGVSWWPTSKSQSSCAPASQLQPLGGLAQQQDSGRCNFPVSTIPDGIHTFPDRKSHWEQHTDRRPLPRVPRTYKPLRSPAIVTPQQGTPHQNDTRPTSILSTSLSRT